jgi:hypothetical protein
MRTNLLIADESELQGQVIAMAEDRGWLVKPSSQGSKQGGRPQRAMRNKTANGFPDLTMAKNGNVLFLECKMDRGDMSPAQLRWSAHVPNHYVIRPADLADGRMQRILEAWEPKL